MAYTPTNWQTGDIITAQKLNNMENGITSTQIYTESEVVRFSNNVTTEENNGMYSSNINCDLSDFPEQIKVTFNDVEYTCERISAGPVFAYGGLGSNGPDFSEYPFIAIASDNNTEVYTETVGTHQIEIAAITKVINEDFTDIINSKIMVIDFASNGSIPIPEVENVIAAAEKGAFITYRKILYDNNDIVNYSYSYNVVVFPSSGSVGFSIGSTDYTHNSTGITSGK